MYCKLNVKCVNDAHPIKLIQHVRQGKLCDSIYQGRQPAHLEIVLYGCSSENDSVLRRNHMHALGGLCRVLDLMSLIEYYVILKQTFTLILKQFTTST